MSHSRERPMTTRRLSTSYARSPTVMRAFGSSTPSSTGEAASVGTAAIASLR